MSRLEDGRALEADVDQAVLGLGVAALDALGAGLVEEVESARAWEDSACEVD